MSWDEYVDSYLMCDLGGRTLSGAAIIGHDGTVWAQSANFPTVKPEEISSVMDAFNNDASSLAQNGLYLGGSKYMVIQGEPGVVIRGKKGAAGVTIKKTNSALIIGTYDDPVTPGECNVIVEKLADYLIEQNY